MTCPPHTRQIQHSSPNWTGYMYWPSAISTHSTALPLDHSPALFWPKVYFRLYVYLFPWSSAYILATTTASPVSPSFFQPHQICPVPPAGTPLIHWHLLLTTLSYVNQRTRPSFHSIRQCCHCVFAIRIKVSSSNSLTFKEEFTAFWLILGSQFMGVIGMWERGNCVDVCGFAFLFLRFTTVSSFVTSNPFTQNRFPKCSKMVLIPENACSIRLWTATKAERLSCLKNGTNLKLW